MPLPEPTRLPDHAEATMHARRFSLRPIGYVRTAHPDPARVPIQAVRNAGDQAALVVFDEFAPGLADLDAFDYALVITLLDRTERAGDLDREFDPAGLIPVPLLLTDVGTRHGLFATRYPERPNPIAISLVRVLDIDGPVVQFTGVDLADGTPVLDIKPWVAAFDLPADATIAPTRCGWYDDLPEFQDVPNHQEIARTARELLGHAAVVARTIRIDGFGATEPGEVALIDRSGIRAGSILGGALDIELRDAATRTTEGAVQLLDFDLDNPSAMRGGLTCGGHANIVMQSLAEVPSRWFDALERREPITLITRLAPNAPIGSATVAPGGDSIGLPIEALDAAARLVAAGSTRAEIIETATGAVLVEVTVPAPRLLVVGRAALADDIVDLARRLGWSADTATADDAITETGKLTDRDAIVVLDHALTASGPLLAAALRGSVGYVGALGSRRTQARRAEHLKSLGVTDVELARLHGPTGLDLGAANAPETALSICAEIIAVRSGRSALPLRDHDGRIGH